VKDLTVDLKDTLQKTDGILRYQPNMNGPLNFLSAKSESYCMGWSENMATQN
jgi:hypothetical protein